MREFIPALPRRASDAHKGRSGAVLIIAGSRDYAGAAALAGLGAARAGAGYVRLAVPAAIVARVAQFSPAAIVLGQRETGAGELSRTARKELLALAAAADAVVLGPGLGRSEAPLGLVADLLQAIEAPLVLDADGLFALAHMSPERPIKSASLVLTPHLGEAARLLRSQPETLAHDREGAAAQLAHTWSATVVVKGPNSVVAAADQRYVNNSGNPALATAGMGDVLAGLIGALLASGLPSFAATATAVWLHGRAADLACEALEIERGLLPEDLAQWLPQALQEITT